MCRYFPALLVGAAVVGLIVVVEVEVRLEEVDVTVEV